ncbi:aminoacyl-histidine dipeptidase [Riemerella anatipestifer]|uniref:Cytosol non-specific dipeptidase n=1 Tax=Riemerella anatipestifer (strain ATCC 11845 / DSM 15868 / JCM 9532 / NCTC 11014) TaxID=693978 RepID=E4T9M0_RIEAD|nr:aminoacyl-histidine dipeptidase [Riemerella anatipestifer]ADQ81701.1 aminoacyl-histidine dipeptidase [Riemerella anatipestifer ATCC 11845 = DSM 15868]ADZ12803.1 Di- and tripeptidase [Riemerella anatipestifer RA-GD]AFD55711.1 aminoacyl-histidine dipeptidase [Riemerella anatipestifer ATCC 11845 = DSM 15868]AGC40391.1 Di- and tripeptidase [Riemerella anatipestifer RA-CH-2]AKP68952.1 aminoacyl-histidine dipeptidase [Riemerella anatipestifer]
MSLSQIEPQIIWKNFSALNAVPRPSKKEERVINFIKSFGENLGLETSVDKTGNVIIRKPATQGMENRQPIILQSHLDMVCQKNNDVNFDFDNQGIEMYVDGDWVRAKGTTLGADNGLGVAAMMSILESTDIAHPALEALFTIDEETGMTGAFGLEPNILNGEILLNLDTEEDDEIDIGCAGGIDVTATQKYNTQKVTENGFRITVKGLKGGHSGMDIHKGLGNANKILARFLMLAVNNEPRLVSIDAGSLRNAIPREGSVSVLVANKEAFSTEFEVLKSEILEEFATLEKDLNISIESCDIEGNALSVEDSTNVILALNAAHNGVYRMSPDVEDLVEASNNIARVELKDGALQILNLSRSSVESSKLAVANQLRASFELAGMEVKFSGSYPGWKPKPGAEIIKVMEEIYQREFNSKPNVVACHAGLECGIIGANYPKMEMVSFGPTIKGAHSPDERASISSTQKFWKFLKEILANIPEKK